MNIISRIGVTGLLAFVALNVCAAPGSTPTASKPKFDVTGTWVATAPAGRMGPGANMVFVLKQDGDKLSGTVSTNGAPPVEIEGARVLRTTIYFTVPMVMPQMPGRPGGPPGMPGMKGMITKYTGSPSGDELKLTSQMLMSAGDGGRGDSPTGTGMPKTELVAKRQ